MKEVRNKRVAGPFKEIPFKNYIQSPIGLVPKAGGKTRLIFHLSYDFKCDDLGSVNKFTPREQCSVKYKDLDFAISAYLKVCEQEDAQASCIEETGRINNSRPLLERKWKNKFECHRKGKTTVVAGKSDLKSAFRILGLSPDSWPWLVMSAQDPKTGE